MNIVILGATGLVGRESLALVGRAWPGASVHLFASRDQVLEADGVRHEVLAAERLEGDDAPAANLALVALDDAHSARFVPRLLARGCRVVDKSNTYRADPQVPLVAAGVNHAEADEAQLVANPNCTTIPLALALRPLQTAFGLRSVTVSTYQAVSGAGLATLDTFLEAQARGYARIDRLGEGFDPTTYAGNVVPHNGGTDASGFSSEERKLVSESRKILGDAALPVSAQCCRVPVAVGHYENVWVELNEPTDASAIETCLTAAPYVRLLPGAAGEGLSAVSALQDRDRAWVGRIRQDQRDRSARTWCLTVVADNLRLGAATNAVRIASRWWPSADPDLRT